jgi:starch synthase
MPLDVWMAASEAAPTAHAGGLGDVLRALPAALARRGHRVTRFLPAYRGIDRRGFAADGALLVPVGPERIETRFFTRREADGVATTLVARDDWFAHDGIYQPGEGEDLHSARRFILFCRAIHAKAAAAGRAPAIIHAHDWQAALLPLLVRFEWSGGRPRPATVLTIHNMGYQGRFPPAVLPALTLPPDLQARLFRPDGIEFYGGVNFLKAGLLYADRVTAVSPTYAAEIGTPDGGFGLDGVVRQRGAAVGGILNGADYEVWDPRTDPHLPARYDAARIDLKERAKDALRERLGIGAPDRPVAGMIGRLVRQKGIDVLLEAGDRLLASGADLALLGSGESDLARGLGALGSRHPGRVAFREGYDEALAHLIVAGSDLLLVPSRYEPCGLVQMHAMRYGTIPVAHRTGGLADTISDQDGHPGSGTGFLFAPLQAGRLAAAVQRAVAARASDRDGWRRLQRRAMAATFSWERAAERYAALYEGLLPGAAAQPVGGKPEVGAPTAGR